MRIPIVVVGVCVAVRFGLSAGPYSNSDCVGFGDLRTAGGGDLDRCPSYGLGGWQVIRDGTAGLSVQILGVRRTAVYRWQPGIWIAASSVSGACGSSGVGPTSRLFTNVLGGSVGQGTSNGSGHQPSTGRRCYVIKSAATVTVCHGDEQDVILHDGLRPRTVVVP